MKLKAWVKVLILLIIVGSIYLYMNNNPKENEKKKTIKNDNSKTYNVIKSTKYYNKEYNDEYQKITYKDDEAFLENITLFLDNNYSAEEINNIMELSKKNIEKLKNTEYININKYYKYKNFDVDNVKRYEEYEKNNPNLKQQDIITYVNINLDLKAYESTKEVDDPTNILTIVNKYNGLPVSYKPNDLEMVSGFYGNDVPMRKVAKEAFLKLQEDAKNNDISLMPTTAYRSADFQKTLYTNYVNKDGKDAADTYSARPGYSDHQTGLAIDLKNSKIKGDTRLSEDDYKWLENNCSKYGFIVRYPKNKENITLYQFENWHIRYIGIDNAKIIMNNNLTLEEYIDLYIKEY